MNPLIETLNRFGDNALYFAWPMLWQSSVLIAILFAADFALRRRVRAAVRYALWLVLLVKLLLPPSLALPTGVAWWLFPAVTIPARPHVTKFVVNYGADTAPSFPLQPMPAFTPPPRPPMSAAAWTILAWSAISVCLLAWLAARWRQVICDVRRATPAPAWLNGLLDEAKDLTGLRRNVRLQLTDQAMSPAVCGLFRPVILLPQSLVEKLPPVQLRAVLLHELTHLRRGDVWMNCAQALVQIIYWWHPLLWLANARIRRVREEAVDDAVMLALRDDAETYAPTLLEVAKLAFHRPLASLGLVGILESRSALRQRIERLMNFRAPRKAGLTIMSLLGICIFSAVALPMGKAAVSAGNQPVSQVDVSDQTLTVKVNPEVFIKNVKAEAATYLHAPTDEYGDILLDILRGEGVDCHPPHGLAFNNKTGEITTRNTPESLEIFRQVIEQLNRANGQCNLLAIPIHRKGVLIQGEFYKMRTADFDDLTKGLHLYDNPHFYNLPWWSVEPDQFAAFSDRVKSLGLRPFQRPRVQTSHGMTAQLYYGNETNSIELSCLPFVTVDQTQRFVALTVQVNTKGWFTDNPKGDWPLHDGTNRYAVNGQVSAEDHGGIVLRAKNPAGENLVVILGIQIITNDMPALNPASGVNTVLMVRGEKRKNTAAELDRIRLDKVSWPDGLPLSEVLRNLSLQTKVCDPDKKGINFTFQTNTPAASAATAPAGGAATLNPTRGLPEATPAGVAVDASSINVKLTLTDMRLGDVLDAIVLAADHPIQYSILDDGIVFSTRGSNSAPLETRTFMVTPDTGLANLRKKTDLTKSSTPDEYLRGFSKLLSASGTTLPPTSIWLKENGLLLVRGTPQQLDAIEQTVLELNGFSSRKPREGANSGTIMDKTNSTPAKTGHSPNLETRTFKVDPITFYSGLQSVGAQNFGPANSSVGDHDGGGSTIVTITDQTANISQAAKQFFVKLGLNLDPPKSVFFNDRLSVLFVRATEQDLDTVEKAIQVLNMTPPQIHIKARFIAVPTGFNSSLDMNQLTASSTNTVGILFATNANRLLKQLESQKDFESLAEPEATTVSGRQTQMRSTDIVPVIDGINPQARLSPGVSADTNLLHVTQLATGPVFDVVPYLWSDGYTFSLDVTASLIEFLGYDEQGKTNLATGYVNGQKRQINIPVPKISKRELKTHIDILDGQTAVLGGWVASQIQTTNTKAPVLGDLPPAGSLSHSRSKQSVTKYLMLVVTVTLVDPAGNRVHNDDEMLIARPGIPPQDSR